MSSLTSYRQGWKALNRLLHEERSFSGNEKNCAFLSMQDGKFASISSVSGLDFNDDSRALALCDWDFDGKLDLWQSARTSPRVRFLQNRTHSTGRFIAIQLRGNGSTTNRDAIGARVEVRTNLTTEKSIRTLHAGDGFLTQSSRWIHFGLGDATAVESVHVQWPGGEKVSYGPFNLDGFYVIDQASGKFASWEPPANRKPLTPGGSQQTTSSQIARIVPPYRLPLPAVDYTTTSDSTKQRLKILEPTLVTIWSDSCPNCLRELKEWSSDAAAFRKSGLSVIALNADVDASAEQVKQRNTMLQQMGFAFQNYTPPADSLRRIDFFQRALMDLWQPMPVPCSFLLDRLGRVAVIYKGPVATTQIMKDMELLEASPEAIRKAAMPFAGIWGTSVPPADPSRVSSQMIDHTLISGATDYLQQFLDMSARSGSNVSNTRRADVQYMQAVLLESQRKPAEALLALESCRALNPSDFRVRSDLAKAYLKRQDFAAAEVELLAATKINPQDLKTRRDLAVCLSQQDKLGPAILQFKQLLKLYPRDAVTHFHYATALRKSGQWANAVQSYQRALQLQPNLFLAANNLAWILSTHPDDTLRDGKLAVSVAERLCQQTKLTVPEFLDTLAAAYAEVGQFENAVKALERAIGIHEQRKAIERTPPLNIRKQLYLQKKPFRDTL